MEREKLLVKNTVIITFGKICTQLISFVLLPIYTALLSTEEYGIVDLLNTYIFLLAPIISLQIEQALFRFLIDSRESEKDKSVLISTTLISSVIQCILYFAIFLLVARFLNNDYKYFLMTNVIACIFSSIMLQISRGLGDNTNYAIGSFITAIVTVVLNIVFVVVFRFGAYGMLISALIANILCSLYIFIVKRLYHYLHWRDFEYRILKKLWKYSLPLIPNSLSWWVVNVSDRTIVSTILGIGMNGIYSAANKFSSLYIQLYNVFNLSWTEMAALHIKDDDNAEFFSRVINSSFKFFASICLGVIAVMPFVFPLLINVKFDAAYYHIPILMISTLCNVVIGLFSVVYVAKKLTKEVAKTSIIAAIINVVVNLALIHFIGLYAASISTAVAYFILMVYRYFDVKKYVDIRLSRKLIASIVLLTIGLLLTYYQRNWILSLAALIVIVAFCYFYNRDILKSGIKIIKNKFSRSST